MLLFPTHASRSQSLPEENHGSVKSRLEKEDLGEVFRVSVWSFLTFGVLNFRAELASTTARHEKQALEKTSQHSQELRLLTQQLQSLSLFLQAKLKENKARQWVFFPAIVSFSLFFFIFSSKIWLWGPHTSDSTLLLSVIKRSTLSLFLFPSPPVTSFLCRIDLFKNDFLMCVHLGEYMLRVCRCYGDQRGH